MSFTPRVAAPVESVLDRIEAIFRTGYSTHLTNATNWTTGNCPAGHWILQEGTKFHRTDDPDFEVRPALVIGEVEGAKPLYETSREVWEIPVFIEVRYSRNYEPAESQALMEQLAGVFTHGLTPDASTFIKAETILSFPVSGSTPGLNVLRVHEVEAMPYREPGVLILRIQFAVRCSGIAAV